MSATTTRRPTCLYCGTVASAARPLVDRVHAGGECESGLRVRSILDRNR